MSHPYYNNQPNHYNYPPEEPRNNFVDRYASYHPSDHQPHPNYPPPPPADSLGNPHYDPLAYEATYPPDHYYHPDQAYHSDQAFHPDQAYHPDYQSDYNHQLPYGLDEKYPPPGAELYPPHTATPVQALNHAESPSHFHSPNPAFGAPTRGSVAAQLAAEGAIPEKAGLRMWRSDEHSGAFTRGGKSKSCGRCCCCTSIVIVIIIVGLIAAFLLWVRPPNATFNGIAPPTAGNQVDLQPNGFLLNFDLNIGVTNPNFFGASFSKISAKAYYPLNTTTPLGGGELEHVDIKPHSNTTINFPFQINYTTSLDPNRQILADIANRCGFLNSAKSPIKISFDITLRLKVLAITISPTFSSSNTFSCPLKQSDFTSVLGGSQSLDALSNLLTGSSGSNNAAPKQARSLARRSSSQPPNDFRDNTRESDWEEDRQTEQLLRKVLNQPSTRNSPSQLKFINVQLDSASMSRLSSRLFSNRLSSLQNYLGQFFTSLSSFFAIICPPFTA